MVANIIRAKDVIEFLIYVIVMIVLPVVTAFAKNYWNAKKDQTVIIAQNQELDNVTKHVISMIVDAVNYTNQIYVDNLKEAAEDHKLTQEEMKNAYEMTYDRIQEMIPEAFRKILESAYKDVDLWIQTEIEAIIRNQRH